MSLSVCIYVTGPKFRLDNNSYLDKGLVASVTKRQVASFVDKPNKLGCT